MKRNFIFAVLVVVAAGAVLTSCKPTEKNYKSAYDAAINKRQKEAVDDDLGLDITRLERDDEAQWRKFGNDSLRVLRQQVKPFESDGVQPKPYCMAVAMYKMPTNARSQRERLLQAGYGAFLLTNGHDEYYVVAEAVDTPEEAIKAVSNYCKKHPKDPYVGLGGSPVTLLIGL